MLLVMLRFWWAIILCVLRKRQKFGCLVFGLLDTRGEEAYEDMAKNLVPE